MQRYSEILRFQEGGRSQHPAPEAAITGPPPGTPAEAGEMLLVLVDLMPKLPHRSREIRATAVNAYWSSTGSVVARLRRALAAANRHLVHVNAHTAPGTKCSGSISCLVFMEDELYLGQIGAAHVYIWYLNDTLELFPKRNRLLIPLGGSLPPIIHIGYTPLVPGNTLLLAATWAAETLARERWREILAHDSREVITKQMEDVMATSKTSGTFVLVQEGVPGPSLAEMSARQRPPRLRPMVLPAEMRVPALPATDPPPPITEPDPARELPDFLAERADQQAEERAIEPRAPASDAPPRARLKLRLPPVRRWAARLNAAWCVARGLDQPAAPERDRAQVRRALRALLPGPIEGAGPASQKQAPPERTSLMSGIVVGVLLLVLFITLTVSLQYGGTQRAEMLLEQSEEAVALAYVTQNVEDWQRVRALAEKVISLEGHNEAAQVLREKAQQAIDALENAAVLKAYPLLDLGTAPAPRRLLVAKNWLYILSPATDEVIELTLGPDRLSTMSETPITILRKGQSFNNVTVDQLVDIAWVQPGGTYPDGALFIYGQEGVLYIYEPTLGPGNILPQLLQIPPHGSVTLMETFGQKIYLIYRQSNQILTYDAINGVYDTARDYFSPEVAPQLQNVLDLGIDGRVYLLMGDGSITAYFSGTEDPSFEVHNLPDPNFHPNILAVDPDAERGLIYLGDTHRERIVVLDKHGSFTHQFRLPSSALQQLEALAISESSQVLYLIAENRLYAAEIPEFVIRP